MKLEIKEIDGVPAAGSPARSRTAVTMPKECQKTAYQFSKWFYKFNLNNDQN